METYNVLERQTETKVRQAQVIYLSMVMDKSLDEIAKITEYAISTVKAYLKKFANLLDYAKSIFEKAIEKVKRVRHSYNIDSNGYNITENGLELCYLFEFYNADNVLVCSKVGTTKRTIEKRIKEELRSKTYTEMGVVSAKVNRIYHCGELPAEGLESLIRSEYIKKYPKSFKKNDRFINVKFDFDLCDKVAKDYLE